MKPADWENISRMIIDITHDEIFCLDPGGIIVRANPAACSSFGFKSEEEILRQSFKFTDLFEFYDLNDTKLTFGQMPVSHALNGERIINLKIKVVRKYTSIIRYWLFSAIPVFDEMKKIIEVIVTIKDISDSALADRKLSKTVKSEQKLLESEEQLRLALMVGNFGYYDFDIPAGRAKVNSQYLTMLEYIPDEVEVTLDWWSDSIYPEDRDRAVSIMNDSISGKIQSYQMEFRMRTKSGGWKWVLCRGKNIEFDKQGLPLRMLGTHVDIDMQKQIEVALRDERNKLTNIAAMLPGVIYSYRQRSDGTAHLKYVSPAYFNILGHSPEEAKKDISPFFALIHPDDIGQVKESIAESERTLTPWHREFRLHNPRKGEIWVEAHSIPHRDADGGTTWHGYATDISDRKLLEKNLLEHTRFIESIINITPDILYIYDLSNKSNVYSNKGIEKILGYSFAEIQAMGNRLIPLLMHPDDFSTYQQSVTPRYAYARDNEQIIHEYRMKNKSGQWRWLLSNEIIYLRSPDGSPLQIFGIARDITDKKNAEEALRESEYFFKESQRAANIGSYKLDFTTGYWKSSEVLDKIFGIGRAYVKNIQTWLDIVHPDDREMMDNYLSEMVISKHDRFNKEYRIICKSNGAVRWVYGLGQLTFDRHGSLISMYGTIQDITDRKQVEETLRESEEKFSKIFNSAPVLISITDMATGKFLEVNERLLGVSGFSRDELIGHTSTEIGWVSPEIRTQSMNEMLQYGRIDSVELNLSAKDGHVITGLVSSERIFIAGRECLLTTWIDITGRKRTEEALRFSEEKFSKAFMTSPDAITITGLSDGVFLEASNGCIKVFGYSREEMIGHTSLSGDLNLWVNKKDRNQMVDALKATGELSGFEVLFRRKDGNTINAILSARLIKMYSKDYILGIARDVTDLKKSESTRNRLTRDLRALSSCNQALVRAENEQSLLNDICKIICDIAGYRMAWVGFVEDHEISRVKIVAKAGPEDFFRIGETYALSSDGKTAIGTAIESKKSKIIHDFANAPAELSWSDYAKKNDYRTAIALPLLDNSGNQLGVLSIYSGELNVFATDETKLLEELASDLSFGIISLRTRAERRIAQKALVKEKYNLQKALKEKDVLLQELYHRTKNNMQVISAYLSMQAMSLNDENLQTIFSEMENRIRAMALVHEKLYRSKDLTNINMQDYLTDLSNLLYQSFPGLSDRVQLDLTIEEIFVTIDIAIPIGLVITELLTNSLKYAFPGDRTGKIFIQMQKRFDGELRLDVNDDGVGAPDSFDIDQSETIGIPTALYIVKHQLHGSIELDRRNGFKWKIIFQSRLYAKRV